MTAEAQDGDPGSVLTLYRAALALRRTHPALGGGPLEWLPAEPGVLAFSRGHGFRCRVNLSGAPVALPAGERVLLATEELTGELPVDAAAWLAGG